MILLKSSRWWCYPYDVILLFLSFTAYSFSILLISVPAFHCQAFWMLLLLLVLVWFSVSWQMLLFLTTSLFWKSVRSERYISLLYSPSSLPPFLPSSLASLPSLPPVLLKHAGIQPEQFACCSDLDMNWFSFIIHPQICFQLKSEWCPLCL